MGSPRLPDDTEMHFVESIDDAMDMKRWLSEDRNRSCVAIDIETTGLSWNRPGDDIRLVQIGDKKHGWAVPWHQWGGAFMECLNAWKGPIALHNMSFDLKFLEDFAKWEVPWDRMHDTMIMSKIMRPGKGAGLKPLSVQLVDPRADAGQKMLKKAMDDNGWGWDTVPVSLPVYHMYGALDTIETAYLFDIFRADLAYPEVYDMEMAYLRCAYQMEKRGFKVDVDYARKKEQDLYDFVEQSRAWAQKQFGVSIGSGPQLIRYFQREGVEITERTPSGAPSMNADQLKLLLNYPDKKIAQLAKVTYDSRKAEKLASTYFKAIVDRNVDGRIHCSINTMGAITGRNSVSQPNLQNLPSNSSVVKNAFIPDDGHLLLSSDLDQVELRLTSCLSKDQGLISLFQSVAQEGGDIFTKLGQDLYNDPTMVKADPRRALVKTFMYASLYGASVRKQAASAGVSVDVMQEFADLFAMKYPGLGRFQQDAINTVNKRYRAEGEGYIITPTTGRRIPVEHDKAYKGTNYIVQSVAADVMKQNVIKLDAAGLGEALRIPVHDEAILSVPRRELEEAKHTVVECMTTTEGWEVPLTADCSDGLDRWGAKYDEDH